MSTTPDIIGLTRELQKMHEPLWKHTPSPQRQKWNKAVTKAFPAIASALLAQTERIAQLERECGKWQTQAEIAKEQSTAWMAENEKLREVMKNIPTHESDEAGIEFCLGCNEPFQHGPACWVPALEEALSYLPTS